MILPKPKESSSGAIRKTNKGEDVQSGGASFSPRLSPRPKYPPFSLFLKETAISFLKAPVLMGIVTLALYSVYLQLVLTLKASGWNDNFIFMFLSMGVHTGLYTSVGGFFFICDQYGFLDEYKLARKKAQIPSKKLRKETIKEAIIDQLVLGPPFNYFGWSLLKYFGMGDLDTKLPGFSELVMVFFIAHFSNQFFFYWAHRIVHSKKLYKYIHKQHHSYIGTEAIAGEYANPIEQVVANKFPVLVGMVLFGRHPLQLLVWLAYILQETYESHSGYYFGDTLLGKLGFFHGKTTAFHDAHHTQNRGNFGCFTMDWLFGTMDAWVDQGLTRGYVDKKKHA